MNTFGQNINSNFTNNITPQSGGNPQAIIIKSTAVKAEDQFGCTYSIF